MQYLIFLNRFDKDKNVLERKLSGLGVRVISEEDDSLLVECKDANGLLGLQEVSRIVKIFSGWKVLNYKTLKEDSLKAVAESNIKEYKIQTRFFSKIKISAKSIYKHINPYLKHEGFSFNENDFEVVLFVEFARENNEIMYRVSYSLKEWYNPVKTVGVDYSKFVIVIENPSLVEEVSDFLRLCWIFKIPLYVLTKNKDFGKLLKKAKEVTKGIEYDKFQLFVVDKLNLKNAILVGFSKLAKENETGLKKFFLNLNEKKVALVFGDDKFGMTQQLRDKMDLMFHLTPELKKPLRGSHAVSYVLGIYSCLKLK